MSERSKGNPRGLLAGCRSLDAIDSRRGGVNRHRISQEEDPRIAATSRSGELRRIVFDPTPSMSSLPCSSEFPFEEILHGFGGESDCFGSIVRREFVENNQKAIERREHHVDAQVEVRGRAPLQDGDGADQRTALQGHLPQPRRARLHLPRTRDRPEVLPADCQQNQIELRGFRHLSSCFLTA